MGQTNLRPDHIFATAPPDTMLATNPDTAVGSGRVDQQDIHRAGRAGGGGQGLHTGAGIGKLRGAQRWNAARAQIVLNIRGQLHIDRLLGNDRGDTVAVTVTIARFRRLGCLHGGALGSLLL